MSLVSLVKRLEERDISLVLTKNAKSFIAKEAYEPSYGARPVKRYLQKNIENTLAKMIIAGDVYDGSQVKVDLEGNALKFINEN